MTRRHGPRKRSMAATEQQIQHGYHAVFPMRYSDASAGLRMTRLSASQELRSIVPKVSVWLHALADLVVT